MTAEAGLRLKGLEYEKVTLTAGAHNDECGGTQDGEGATGGCGHAGCSQQSSDVHTASGAQRRVRH